MGPDVNGLRVNEKVTVKRSPEKGETNGHIPEDQIVNGNLTDEKPNELGKEISNHEPVERIIETEVQSLSEMNLGTPVKSAAASEVNGAEKSSLGVVDLHNPIDSLDQEKKTPIVQISASKQRYHVIKSHYDEDDNWSLASSATSVRTKVTVPVAPRFTCVDRLERRKEFYTKLEEKHKALEKEKHDYQARIKEEEQAAIKLLRKNMSYKANPVPSFYREGPPPKVELKKLPVTRAKSPNFTRRKSCGDAVTKATPEKMHGGRPTRHSIGATKGAKASPLSSKSNAQNGSPTPNRSIKVRSRAQQIKEPVKISVSEGKSDADIASES